MHFKVSSLSSWFILGSAGLFTVNQLGSNSPTSLTKPLIYCQLSSTFSLASDFFLLKPVHDSSIFGSLPYLSVSYPSRQMALEELR